MNEAFFLTVGTLAESKDFEGGNEKQRKHLNELVAWQKAVTRAARKAQNGQGAGMVDTTVWIAMGGARVQVAIPLRLV